MQNNTGVKAFEAGGAVPAHALVKLSSGKVVVCTATATDLPIGVARYAAASGELVAIELLNAGGTIEMIASEAISQGEAVFAAADGEIQDLPTTSGTYKMIGYAMDEATADQDIIEVLPAGYTTTVTVS
jgi:hypothetical protein